jgi:hypothetical protein
LPKVWSGRWIGRWVRDALENPDAQAGLFGREVEVSAQKVRRNASTHDAVFSQAGNPTVESAERNGKQRERRKCKDEAP